MTEFRLNINDDISIQCYGWYPETAPRGVVQIIHGVAEHMKRYNVFAEFLVSNGFAVVGEDHPGHGLTAEQPEDLGYLSGGWNTTVNGIHLLREHCREVFGNVPHIMLGHSMGSFLLRTYLFDPRCSIDGAIISGTGWQNPVKLLLGRAICKTEAARLGEAGHSKLLQKLVFDAYNNKFKPVRTSCDWLTCDEAIVDRYCADPLCGFPVSVQLCREMFRGLFMIENRSNLQNMDRQLPVLFISGDKDPVGDMGKGVVQSYRMFQRIGMQRTELKLYANMRHETLNEIDKMTVYTHIFDWICSNI